MTLGDNPEMFLRDIALRQSLRHGIGDQTSGGRHFKCRLAVERSIEWCRPS
jgi:hypothetical protein